MNPNDRLLSQLEQTNAVLETLHARIRALAVRALSSASPDELPQLEAEAALLVDTITQTRNMWTKAR